MQHLFLVKLDVINVRLLGYFFLEMYLSNSSVKIKQKCVPSQRTEDFAGMLRVLR